MSIDKQCFDLMERIDLSKSFMGRKVVAWYRACGDAGAFAERAMLKSLLSTEARQEEYNEKSMAPSSSSYRLPPWIPTMTALLALPQGGKSFGQHFFSFFARSDGLKWVCVHIAPTPMCSSQFYEKLTENCFPLSLDTEELNLRTKAPPCVAKRMTKAIIVAATEARLVRLAIELYCHYLFCVENHIPYQVCCRQTTASA